MKGKKLKKWLSGIAAMAMAFSMMATGVNAAPSGTTGIDKEATTGSLTLQKSGDVLKSGSEYSAYQILNADYVENQDVYNYSWTDSFEDFADKATTDYGMTLEEIGALTNGNADYTFASGDTADKLATALEKFVTDNNTTVTATATATANEQGTAKFESLPIGYYLILETKNTEGYKTTKPIIVAVPSKLQGAEYDYDVEVTLKDQPVKVTKTVSESKAAEKDSKAEQVGKEFTFTLESVVPKYDDTYKNIVYKLTDTMDNGFDLVADSIKVYGNEIADNNLLSENTDYGLTVNGKTLTFDFSDNSSAGGTDYYAQVKGYNKIIITYEAKLNKDANFTVNGNTNTVTPTFGDSSTTTTTGTPDKAKVYSGTLQFTKLGENSEALKDVSFTIYKADENGNLVKDDEHKAGMVVYEVDEEGNITTTVKNDLSSTVTTSDKGLVQFSGLGEGTYYIVENEAPSGYVLPKEPIKVVVEVTLPDKIETGDEEATFKYTISGGGVDSETVIQDENDTAFVKFNVINSKGFTLPTTGGAGTYLFTIGGAILMLAAASVFIISRRKANTK